MVELCFKQSPLSPCIDANMIQYDCPEQKINSNKRKQMIDDDDELPNSNDALIPPVRRAGEVVHIYIYPGVIGAKIEYLDANSHLVPETAVLWNQPAEGMI